MLFADSNVNVQESLRDISLENQLNEPSQLSYEIQVWSKFIEQKNNDRIVKMREEMDNIFEAIPEEIRTNKSLSNVTNPRSETIEALNTLPTGSKIYRSSRIEQ